MALEIERKFLVTDDGYKNSAKKTLYRQGYLSLTPERTVRVRICDDKAYLTIKGNLNGITRPEFEYSIPVSDAEVLLSMCEKPIIEKYRYTLTYDGVTWIVDEFSGDNEGLVIAEVELDDENQPFSKPGWAGEEVSGDPRYYSSNLVRYPYKSWNR
ncbi:MAG: CYTH domain-containing protein [Clostridiaceae bacterium]|nr:CYTH domain-containing protein [Clostridiaceae bacterium]